MLQRGRLPNTLSEVDRTVLARWGKREELLWKGFVAVPRAFFWHAAKIGLTPVEGMFVLHLMTYKWDENAPYPSFARLADNMGVSVAYVKKIASALSQRGLILKARRASNDISFGTNEYELQPLFNKLAQEVKNEERRRR